MRSATIARFNFEYALEDVDDLLKHHDAETGGLRGRPSRDLEVYKRAAVILLVTAWESYVEDTLRQQFKERLDAATAPTDVSSAFNAVSQYWLAETKPTPISIQKWAGDGWRVLVRERFDEQVNDLNTPGSKNVRALYKRYLGMDVTNEWRWSGTSSASACGRLDALIRLRGALVHRGKELFESRQGVKRADVVKGRDLIVRLVERTDIALGIEPKVFAVGDA